MLTFLLLCIATTPTAEATAVSQTEDTKPQAQQAQSQPQPVLHGHLLTGACLPGLTRSVDIGTSTPIQYSVEILYSSGLSEQMLPDLWFRPSQAWSGGDDRLESPFYRDGSTVVFTCGYHWETGGPIIDGQVAGQATSYRLSWFTLD